MPLPAHPSSGPVPGRRQPGDLDVSEEGMAAWFGALDRRPPPPNLEREVLDTWAPPAATRRPSPPRWRLPVAALAAAVLGGALIALLSTAANDASSQAPLTHRCPVSAPAAVVDDPSVPLYRNLETFRALDGGGLDGDDLVASGGSAR